MMSPPLPGTSWLPTRAPSSTTHLPPDVFLLVRLCPVLADTFQPVRSLPLKIGVKPSSDGLSSAGNGGAGSRRRAATSGTRRRGRRVMGVLRGGAGDSISAGGG